MANQNRVSQALCVGVVWFEEGELVMGVECVVGSLSFLPNSPSPLSFHFSYLVYVKQSFHVSTPVNSSTESPARAASTAGTPNASPPTQRTTAPAIVAAITPSSRDRGPNASSRAAAAAGASGVDVMEGGDSL